MWELIVAFDKKMKHHPAYRTVTVVPRYLYRLIMFLRKKLKQLKQAVSKLFDHFRNQWNELKSRFHESKEAINQWMQEHQWENIKSRERERYLKEGGRMFPVVSVIMPVYNAEPYLFEAMDSLLNQTVSYFEVIAVDDGSTDNSLNILRQFAERDKRLKVFHQKNQYAGAARNLGMRKAKGRYLLFLDADDTFEPHLIETSVQTAVEHDADVVLFGANYNHMTQGKMDRAKWQLNTSLLPEMQPFSWKDCPETIFQITLAVPWTKLFRRSFIRKTKLKFQRLYNANDVFFCYSAIAMAKRIAAVDEALVTYRMGHTSNLQSSTKRCFDQAYSAWRRKLIQLGMYESVKRSYVNAAVSSTLHNLSKVTDEAEQKKLFEKIKLDILAELGISGFDIDYFYDLKKGELLKTIEQEDYESYRKKA